MGGALRGLLGRFRPLIGRDRSDEKLFERQMTDLLEIATHIEQRGISVREIEILGFRLAKAGGQIDALISLPQRLRFEFDQKPARESLAAQVPTRPDALELRRSVVVALERAAG
jgi:hypothetical protein